MVAGEREPERRTIEGGKVEVRVEERRVESLANPSNPLQSPLWARLKERVGWVPSAFSFQCERGSGELLALSRPIVGGYPHTYVPFGPEVDLPAEEQGSFLEGLSRGLRSRVEPDTVFIRYDLPWESPYPAGEQTAPPPPRIRELRMNFGTAEWNLRKSPTDVQPPDTVRLDIRADDEVMLARMHRKTRYNIRLSKRHGVTVRRGTLEDLPAWYEVYRQTGARKRIAVSGPEYFESLLELAADDSLGDTNVALLVAQRGDHFLGGIIVAAESDTAFYLYGATSYRYRRLMPAHALQWEALRWARGIGCAAYDLHGIPPNDDPAHPLHGLYRFKTGFGGRKVHRRGCWDFPLDPERYDDFGAREAAAFGFHLPA